MSNNLRLTAAVFFLFTVCSAHAAPLQKHTFEISTERSLIRYKEPGVMKEEGWMGGIGYAYTYRGWLPFFNQDDQKGMVMAEGRSAWGQVDYTGSGTLDNIDDALFEGRLTAGYEFSFTQQVTVLPFFGFGYRYLNDDMGGRVTSTGAHGYERESNYYYSPVGVFVEKPLAHEMSVRACFEYDHFWQGRQISHLSNVAGYSDVRNKQQKGFGLRSSVRVKKRVKRWDLFIEPFARYWNIKRSKESEVIYNGFVSGTGIEPKNNSLEAGIRLGAAF